MSFFVWKPGGARKPGGAMEPAGAREPAGPTRSQEAYLPLFLHVSSWCPMAWWCGVCVIDQNGKFHMTFVLLGKKGTPGRPAGCPKAYVPLCWHVSLYSGVLPLVSDGPMVRQSWQSTKWNVLYQSPFLKGIQGGVRHLFCRDPPPLHLFGCA